MVVDNESFRLLSRDAARFNRVTDLCHRRSLPFRSILRLDYITGNDKGVLLLNLVSAKMCRY